MIQASTTEVLCTETQVCTNYNPVKVSPACIDTLSLSCSWQFGSSSCVTTHQCRSNTDINLTIADTSTVMLVDINVDASTSQSIANAQNVILWLIVIGLTVGITSAVAIFIRNLIKK